MFNTGDIVAMSHKWLKSTQAHDYGRAHGRITSAGPQIVEIQWIKGRAGYGKAHISNLVLVSRMHLEPY
jgi:hypothetical protein